MTTAINLHCQRAFGHRAGRYGGDIENEHVRVFAGRVYVGCYYYKWNDDHVRFGACTFGSDVFGDTELPDARTEQNARRVLCQFVEQHFKRFGVAVSVSTDAPLLWVRQTQRFKSNAEAGIKPRRFKL